MQRGRRSGCADSNLSNSVALRAKLSNPTATHMSDARNHVGNLVQFGAERRSLKLTLWPFERSIKAVNLFARLARDDSAATAVEYSLILGGIAAAIIVMIYVFGDKVNNLYNNTQSRWP